MKSRKTINKIVKFIERDCIIVLHGARQVGKTTIMHYLMDYLKKDKSVADNFVFYMDLEDFILLDLCNKGPEEVLNYIKGKGCDLDGKVYLFIDEIQYLNNPSSFLKLFHDRYKGKVKLIVSGSSSFNIKTKFKDSLVGRTIDFEIFGLDFEEFLNFKGKSLSLESKVDSIVNELKDLYKEYVLFGSYPAIVLEPEIAIKEEMLKQIINTYIKKDIKDLANIRDLNKFNNLIKILAAQTGNLLNVLEIANTLGISQASVEKYLLILENTYIIRRVYPFHKNIKSELTKMPKIYFEDTGIVNLFINKQFSQVLTGQLFEQSIFSELRKNKNIDSLFFWRTTQKQEIDFIIDGVNLVPIEVKLKYLNKDLKIVRRFLDYYKLDRGFICSLDVVGDAGGYQIRHLYPWEVLRVL